MFFVVSRRTFVAFFGQMIISVNDETLETEAHHGKAGVDRDVS